MSSFLGNFFTFPSLTVAGLTLPKGTKPLWDEILDIVML